MEGFEYVGFWKRALVALIDAVITIAISFLLMPFLYWCIEEKAFFLILLQTIIWMAFWSVFLVIRFGGTPGKLILGIRIVDKEGNYLALIPALFRISPGIIITTFYMLGYKLLIDNFPGFSGKPSFLEFGKAVNEYGGSPMRIAMYSGYFVYLDVAVVLFNEKKRAIHDYLASSYVVTKSSLLRAKSV